MPKTVFGGNWKGIGNSWLDDQPGYAVDCLNVMASRDGQWLRSRPGFTDCLISTTDGQIYGLAVSDKQKAGKIGWCITAGTDYPRAIQFMGGPYSETAEFRDYSGTTFSYKWSASTTKMPIVSSKFVDHDMYFSRRLNWSALRNTHYNATTDNEDYPFLANQGDDGVYLDGQTYMYSYPVLAERTTGNLTASKTYGVSWQFITRDVNGKVVSYSTPHWGQAIDPYTSTTAGNSASITLSGSGAGIAVTLPYKTSAFRYQLGWDVEDTTTSSNLKSGWMGYTHVRILRTVGDVADVYYVAEEYPIGYVDNELWRDDTATYANVYSIAATETPTKVRYYVGDYDDWEFGANQGVSSGSLTVAPDFASLTTGVNGRWYFDGSRIWIKDSSFSSRSYFFDTAAIQVITDMADANLVVEYEEYRGCPDLCWIGLNHGGRLLVLSSESRVAKNGNAEIWYSLPNNYTTFTPTSFLSFGHGDVPVAAVPVNGTDALIIITNKNAYLLNGSSPELYTVTQIGSNCGCASLNAAFEYGNTVAWFGTEGLYASNGGTPVNISPALLYRFLRIGYYKPIHVGFGCGFNGQLWYRPWTYAKNANGYKGLVYDFSANTVWPVDRTVEAYRDATLNGTYCVNALRDTPSNDYDYDRAFCLYSRTAGNAPESIGQFNVTNYLKNDYNHYDVTRVSGTPTNTEMTRFWVSPWYTMGSTEKKRINKIRMVASPNTRIKLTVEGTRNWTQNADLVPNHRECILTGQTSDWQRVADVQGEFIRFRLEGVGTDEFDVRNFEVDYEVMGK